MDARLTVVYDNETTQANLAAGWGFACLVEAGGSRLLFDTGWDGAQLQRNMARLGIAPDSLDAVALSHAHWDHVGGLPALLDAAPDLTVFAPASFSQQLKREITTRAALVEITGARELLGGVRTMGELGREVREQSLLMPTRKGHLLVTGCAHPGLAEIIAAARDAGPLHGVLGGFHGFARYEALDDLHLVVPCHCTQHTAEIRRRHPGPRCGAGSVFELPGDGV